MTDSISTTIVKTNQASRMTTVEIARRTGKRHDHVMRDASLMLSELYGENSLPKFGELYTAANGQTYECYALGKDDILTLISGYSIPLRAEIVRRLSELESGSSTQPSGTIPTIAAEDLTAFKKISEIFGLTGNQALLSANSAVKKLHGINCMELIGITHLVAEDQKQYFTPTQLGKTSGLSAIKTNKMLETNGYQEAVRDHKGRKAWVVTEKGKSHCQLLDTNKKHSDGTPVLQIKWAKNTIERIK